MQTKENKKKSSTKMKTIDSPGISDILHSNNNPIPRSWPGLLSSVFLTVEEKG